MYKYYVIDWYEGKDIICKTNNKKEAFHAGRERHKDTDGECNVCIYNTSISSDKLILQLSGVI